MRRRNDTRLDVGFLCVLCSLVFDRTLQDTTGVLFEERPVVSGSVLSKTKGMTGLTGVNRTNRTGPVTPATSCKSCHETSNRGGRRGHGGPPRRFVVLSVLS